MVGAVTWMPSPKPGEAALALDAGGQAREVGDVNPMAGAA
jgi:hypothetical protein